MSANYQYINDFAKENYDRITILVPKGAKARIKKVAENAGKNVSDYITSLMPVSLVGTWKKKEKE